MDTTHTQEPAPSSSAAQPAGFITVTGSTSAGEEVSPSASPAALSAWEDAIRNETNPMGME